MNGRLDQYESLLGKKAILGLEEKAERRATKTNKGELSLKKRKHVDAFRRQREMTALSGGRDALALIGGGDATQRDTLLSAQTELSRKQLLDVIGDDIKDNLKDEESRLLSLATKDKKARQLIQAAEERGESLSMTKARRRLLGID